MEICFPFVIINGCDDSPLLRSGSFIIISCCSLSIIFSLIGLYLIKKWKKKVGKIIYGFYVILLTSSIFITQAIIILFDFTPYPILATIAGSLPAITLFFMFRFVNQISILIPRHLFKESNGLKEAFFNILSGKYFRICSDVLCLLQLCFPLIGFINQADRYTVTFFGIYLPSVISLVLSLMAFILLIMVHQMINEFIKSYRSANLQIESVGTYSAGSTTQRHEVETTLKHLNISAFVGEISIIFSQSTQIYTAAAFDQILKNPTYRILPWVMISIGLPLMLLGFSTNLVRNESLNTSEHDRIVRSSHIGGSRNSYTEETVSHDKSTP